MKPVVIRNKLIEHNISIFRDKRTSAYNCSICVENISFMLAGAVSQFIPDMDIDVETPLGMAKGRKINSRIVLVPIMRAGYSMVSGFWRMYPEAIICPIWLSRNKDLSINIHHEKILHDLKNVSVIILDSVLATGGTAITAIDLVSQRGAKNIVFSSILSTKAGINCLDKDYRAQIVTASENETLDKNYYVYPGVGDSGDRLFGSDSYWEDHNI